MNKSIYQDAQQNAFRVSEYKHFKGQTRFSNLAIKLVVEGAETYLVEDKQFIVQAGGYIVGNNEQATEVNIAQKTLGICLDISVEIIEEISLNLFGSPQFTNYLLSDQFLINQYNIQNSHLAKLLCPLANLIRARQQPSNIPIEFFYQFGEGLVRDQVLVFEQLARMNYKKAKFGQEVFCQLSKAKGFMDVEFLKPLSLDDLASVAFMSKYAFIRLFKTTFGLTPYQYLLEKRLQYAKDLILAGEKIAEVALQTSFADTASFSKAFKHYFGQSPSKISNF